MSLKNLLERELGIPIRVRAGAPGSLKVVLNGETIYSKKQAGRLPDPAQIVRSIHQKVPGQ